MEVLLGLVVTVWMLVLPAAALLVPLTVILTWWPQRSLLAALLYAGALACLVAQLVALDANLDWADRTGGAGTMFAGWYWLVLAVVLAVASVLVTLAKRSPRPAQ